MEVVIIVSAICLAGLILFIVKMVDNAPSGSAGIGTGMCATALLMIAIIGLIVIAIIGVFKLPFWAIVPGAIVAIGVFMALFSR